MKRLLLFLILGILVQGCSSTPKIPIENEKKIKAYWRLYLQESPEWPAARERWLAMGEAERRALVYYLILHIRTQPSSTRLDEGGNPVPVWLRSVRELQFIGPEALKPLLMRLKDSRDETEVYPLIEAAAGIARAEDLEGAFKPESDRKDVVYQCRLVKVLIRAEDPEAVPLILKLLGPQYDWQVRATAADVLRDYDGPMLEAVLEALERVTKDEDEFVASKAKESLDSLNMGSK